MQGLLGPKVTPNNSKAKQFFYLLIMFIIIKEIFIKNPGEEWNAYFF